MSVSRVFAALKAKMSRTLVVRGAALAFLLSLVAVLIQDTARDAVKQLLSKYFYDAPPALTYELVSAKRFSLRDLIEYSERTLRQPLNLDLDDPVINHYDLVTVSLRNG